MGMSQKQDDDTTPTPPEKSTVILLLKAAADTTWRMFVPTIGGTLLGVTIDKSAGTLPWWTIIISLIGVTLTVLLIRDQLKKLQ